MAGRSIKRTIVYAVLIITALLMIGPFYWMVATSFKLPDDVFASPPKWIPSPWNLAELPRCLHAVSIHPLLPE